MISFTSVAAPPKSPEGGLLIRVPPAGEPNGGGERTRNRQPCHYLFYRTEGKLEMLEFFLFAVDLNDPD